MASTSNPEGLYAFEKRALSLERAAEPFSTARSSRRGRAERLESGLDAAADELLPDGFEFLTSFRVGSDLRGSIGPAGREGDGASREAQGNAGM